MVDFQSQCKEWGYKYTAPKVTDPIRSHRDINRYVEPLVFSTERVPVHDCRIVSVQEQTEPSIWEAHIMSGGIKKTYQGIGSLHHKEKQENEDGVKTPDKLLFNGGKKGSKEGELNFPRGMTVAKSGDIIVADTMNNRIQIYNMCAYFKDKFGKKGKEKGEFTQPTGVATMENGRIVVADSKNKRIQVFTEDYTFKYMFPTKHEPYYVACDKSFNIIVSSIRRTVDVYRRQGALKHTFSLPQSGSPIPAPVAFNPTKEEIMICDLADGMIKFFTYNGDLVRQFQPESNYEGIAFQPSNATVNTLGQILVSDGLNHCINAYTETGSFLQEVIKPCDDLGTVNSLSVGPEGHLAVTECSTNAEHCVKVFRYKDCKCHRQRPGSSKRPSRASTPVQDVMLP